MQKIESLENKTPGLISDDTKPMQQRLSIDKGSLQSLKGEEST